MSGFAPAHEAALLAAVALGAGHSDAAELADHLYEHWYAAPACAPVEFDPAWPPVTGMLRAGQAAVLRWTPATVARTAGGGVIVARDGAGRRHALLRGDYAHPAGSDRAGLLPQAGEDVLVLARSGAAVDGGWWRTWGGGWDPRTAPAGVTRVYLAPEPARLPALIGALTATLEGLGGPWLVKVGTEPATLARPDALVVYLDDGAPARAAVAAGAAGLVRPEPGPPLTAPLAPGIAWAEDPGDGRSFGEVRCGLLAEALLGATGRDAAQALAAITQAFAAAGLDPAAPHLRGVSRD